jgi:hypothetical protein
MKTELYTFYDRVAQQCGPVFHARNEADAIRTFMKSFEEKPERNDFELLHIGAYDHDSGKIIAEDIPEMVPCSFPVEKPGGNGKDA